MNKTVLRRYTIEGVEPALLKSPKLLGKGNLNLSALINKLAEAEGQEAEVIEHWIDEPKACCNALVTNDIWHNNELKANVVYQWVEDWELDDDGTYIDSRIIAEPKDVNWTECQL